MNKNLCVPDNDANILRFLSIAGGNATTETGEFWMDLDAYPSLDLCPGRTRVFSLRAAPWKLAAPFPPPLYCCVATCNRVCCRQLPACDMSAICGCCCCAVSIDCSNNLSMHEQSPLSLSSCCLFRALHDGSSAACRMKQSTFVDATSSSSSSSAL